MSCRLERDVVRAAGANKWTDSLRSHVGSCDDCAAAASVGGWMQELAAVDPREHRLPDPAVVWLKAHLLRGAATADRVTRPMSRFQVAAYLIVAAGWATILTWKWDLLQTWLLSFTPKHFVLNASGGDTSMASLSLAFFVGVFLLASMTVMLALHTILAEE